MGYDMISLDSLICYYWEWRRWGYRSRVTR